MIPTTTPKKLDSPNLAITLTTFLTCNDSYYPNIWPFCLNKPNVSTFLVNLTQTKHFDVWVAGLCAKEINKSWLGYQPRNDEGVRKSWDKIKGNSQTTVGMDDDNGNPCSQRCVFVISVFSQQNKMPLSSLCKTQCFFSFPSKKCPYVQEGKTF